MAGENNGPDDTGKKDDDPGKQEGTGKEQEQKKDEFAPVTFKTQEELDAAFKDRVDRAKTSTKDEVLKQFTDAGATPEQAIEAWKTWKAEEDKKKSPETLEREKRQEAERELAAYKAKERLATTRAEAAQDPALKINDKLSIPAELLSGDTKEAMVEHGKALIAFFTGVTGPRAPGYNPGQGHSNEDTVHSGDPIRNYFQTGSFT